MRVHCFRRVGNANDITLVEIITVVVFENDFFEGRSFV